MKKCFILFSAACLFSSMVTTCFAERCPTADEIQSQGLGAWHLFYDGESMDNMIGNFKKEVGGFYQADYMPNVYDGPAQCFYRDKTGAEMEMYLVRFDLAIIEDNPVWKKNWDHFSCTAGINECQFVFLEKQDKKAF